MKTQSSFNAETVPWQRGVVIDADDRPEYPVTPADIENYRTDGVVLLRGAGADWVDRLRTGHMMESDPSIDATMCVYTSALNDYVRGDLAYESDLPYEILTDRVHPWDYEDFKNAYVDVSESLREVMARNPFMKVFVANGYFDLATPHFATEYTFSHMGLSSEIRDNVEMTYYDAGHMMYVHLESLDKLADDLRTFIADAS